MNDEKSIAGFKKSEFLNATPERVFGSSDVRVEELPEGIRLYLREKRVDLGNKQLLINVYRLVDSGGFKFKKKWCAKFVNHKPEDSDIAEQCGSGSFVWVGKWLNELSEEVGIISETIEIDEESGRAAHEAWLRKQNGGVLNPTTVVGPAPAVSSNFGGDALAFMKIMEAAEEKTLSRIERIAHIFQGQKSETPAEVLKSAYQGASDMMLRAVETNNAMARSVNRANQLSLSSPAAAPAEPAEDPEPEGPRMPSWLEPFMPHIERGIGKLLEGGPLGSAVKTLILSSDEWQEIFNDKEKWGQAVSAMEQHFGSDQTRKALDILLNRKEKQKGKGK